jgi:hypothetical protein
VRIFQHFDGFSAFTFSYWTMDMKALWLFQTSGILAQQQSVLYLNLQQHHCEDLKSHNINNNGNNSWHQNIARFLQAYRDQSFFQHSVHLRSHLISLTESQKTIKWRKVSWSERKVSEVPTLTSTSIFKIFIHTPASKFSAARSFSALLQVNTFLQLCSGIWKDNLQALNVKC